MLGTINWIYNHPLSRGRRLQNLSTFAGWQLTKRLPSFKPRTFKFVNGLRMIVAPGMSGITGSMYVGLQEFPEMAFTAHLLRKESLFVDVGANVGSYTILAASVRSDVIAFEPNETAFHTLARNIAINRLAIDVRCCAIGNQVGHVRFDCGINSVVGRIDANGDTIVPINTLDNAIADRLPTLIKIDIEGGEKAALQGALGVLGKPSLCAAIIEMNDHSVIELMQSHGFTPVNYNPISRQLSHGASGDNCIFVRNYDEVQRRLLSAPRIHVKHWRI